MRDKELAVLVREAEVNHGQGLWLCNNSAVAQFIVAQGLHCLNGVQQAANPSLWEQIDTDRKYQNVWNRYAHISAGLVKDGEMYGTLIPNSRVTWYFDHRTINKLGVKYLLWSGAKIHEPWVEYLGRSRLHFIYRVVE